MAERIDCIVELDYEAEQPDELTIKTGQIIKNVMTEDGGWWEGELDGKKGMFPDNFVRIIEKTPKDKPHATVEKNDDTKKDLSRIKDGIPVGGSQEKKVDCIVELDYEAEQPDELTIKTGQIIKNVMTEDGGWWEGELDGKKGIFPDNFVKIIEKTPKDKPHATVEKNDDTKKDLSRIKDGIPVGGSQEKKVDCIVELDYEAEQPDELTIKTGQIIKNVMTEDGGWWEGELDGKKGIFPDNFVKIIEKTPKDKPHATVEKNDDTKKDLSRIKDGIPVGGSQEKKVDCIVELDYEAEQPDELTIKTGQIIKNVMTEDGGWWEGELDGKKGMFPDNFVRIIEKTPKDKLHATVEKNDDTKKDLSRIKDGIPVGGSPKKKESHQSVIKRAKVLFSYEPENEDELKLDVDSVVEVFKQEEEGWWEGSLNGKTGVFPSNFVQVVEELEPIVKTEHIPESHQSVIKRAKVLFSYEPENEDELKLDVDSVVEVFKQEEEGWWEGSLNGKTGVFPSNFVQVVEELEPSVKTEHIPGVTMSSQ